MSVGSILSNTLREDFYTTFPDRQLLISYGMTEILISITKPNESKIDYSVGSTIFPNTLVKIVDDDGNALDIGETGEICAKSCFKFMVSLTI
jgi:acyl-CoA synthetase (AMP-forming)/AMP-acid ligase II